MTTHLDRLGLANPKLPSGSMSWLAAGQFGRHGSEEQIAPESTEPFGVAQARTQKALQQVFKSQDLLGKALPGADKPDGLSLVTYVFKLPGRFRPILGHSVA